MSTNPFDFDDESGGRRQQQQHARFPPSPRQQQQQQKQQQASNSARANISPTPPTRSYHTVPRHAAQHQHHLQRPPATTAVAPIFSARGVEWPLPSALPPAQYRRLRRESRSLGLGIGIPGSGIRFGPGDSAAAPTTGVGGAGHHHHHHHHFRGGAESIIGGGGGGAPAFASRAASGGDGVVAGGSVGHLPSSSGAVGGGGGGGGGSTTGGGGGYGGLTGLMGRVLGASPPPSSGVTNASSNLANDIEEADLGSSATRLVWPPQARCVAAANGWIVAVVECGPPPNAIAMPPPAPTSSSASSSSRVAGVGGGVPEQHPPSKLGLVALIPPLRLVSRWNVRRGTTLGSDGNHLVPLPPPVRATADADATAGGGGVAGSASDPNFGRVAHAFVDPTGCHVLLSARNGEAYYLHSTSKAAAKLGGFGPGADGSYAGSRAGATLAEATVGGGEAAAVQTGLTPGSYVTAVGWDRDRGTEGSTKRILLGTSFGELYEYSLQSPLSSVKLKSTPFDAKAGEINAMMEDSDSDPIDSPVLLHRLNATGISGTIGASRGNIAFRSLGGDGSAVCGILFHRVVAGVGAAASGNGGSGGCVIVMASTGGLHRHTRLHTFRSEPSTSSSLTLRSAFARPASSAVKGGGSSRSFVELPGSVEFAELCSCNDESFALRTETGIYYGTIERSASGITSLGCAGGIVGAGMLTYDSLGTSSGLRGVNGNSGGMLTTTPASIGLTPHHFITLSSTNNVKFINRVARKVIQEERVDWVSLSQASPAESDLQYRGSIRVASVAAEFLTDVRRPDQIWLRKERSLVHISSSCEDRDVWKYHLAQCIETVITPRHNVALSGGAADGAISSPGALLTSEEKHIESQFEYAKSLCINPSQKAVVNKVRAEYHLSQGRVELAAKYMAQCPSAVMPFADTALRLLLPMIGGDSNSDGAVSPRNNSHKANGALSTSNLALITFLTDKMKAAKSNHDSVVCTILGTWLTELHLQEREIREEQNVRQQKRTGLSQPAAANKALLHQFLSSFVRDMDAMSIIKVLASHDISAGECAGYAAAAGDIGAAVNAALSGEDEKNGALDALRVLNDSPIEKSEPYYYRYASTLLSRVPTSAAKSFVGRFTEGLNENKLLPHFMHYEQRRKSDDNLSAVESGSIASYSTFVNDPNASITYMEGVIKLGSQSRAIFNYLTSLYASLEDEGPLFRFLSAHVPPAASSPVSTGGGVGALILKQAEVERNCLLDKGYALRTILRTGRHFRSAVKLYMGFGMRQQAVELALKVDPSLARELARQCDDKDETKRLWLMIARNAAGNGTTSHDGKDVVSRVVMVLKECGPEILSIEDVLPFLPDFAQIDQFKDEICDALASYSSKIEHYLKEMNECDQTCDALRNELSRLKNTGTPVRSDARCALTNKHIFESGEPFYAFPSGYVVLETALKREVIPYLNGRQRDRLKFVENELGRIRKSHSSGGRSPIDVAKYDYEVEDLTAELGGLIAAECPLTGSVMVESIDRGFSSDEED